jgi:hypothetical protein
MARRTVTSDARETPYAGTATARSRRGRRHQEEHVMRKFTGLRVLACAALAAAYGAALADDRALAPLQVPAKSLPVPADVSPELQRIIAAP